MSKIIGIDLGTTNCCGAYYDPFKEKSASMVLFKDETGDPLLPSNLAIHDGQVLVGSAAKNRPNSVQFVKRVELNRDQQFAILGAAETAKIQICQQNVGSFSPVEILGEDFK